MKTRNKTLLIVLAMALVCVMSVAVTMAFLTDTTDKVTNTFSAAGLIDETFILKEHKAALTNGEYVLGTDVVDSNTYDTVVPAMKLQKDPYVSANIVKDVPAYIFIEVVDGITTIPETTTASGLTWAIDDANWTEVTVSKTQHTGAKVYVYNTVKTGDGTTTLELDQVNIIKDKKINVGETLADGLEDLTLDFYGYAVQATGFTDAAAAWAATFGK